MVRGFSLAVSAALLSLLLGENAKAEAEPGSFILANLRGEYAAGAAECPTASDLASGVEQRLGRPVFVSEKDADVDVVASWSQREPGFSVKVALSMKQGLTLGTRTLSTEAARCSELHESLALVLALMLDVSREEFREKRAQVTEVDRPEVPERQPTPLFVPVETEAQSPKDAWASSVLTTLSRGRLPGTAVGLRTRLYWRPAAFWGAALDLSYFFEEIERVEDAGSSFSALTVGLSLCPLEAGGEVLGGAVCAGINAGRIRAQGFGFSFNRTASRMTLDVAARGVLTLRFASPLRLELGAETWVNTQRHQFFHTDASGLESEIFALPLFGAAAELGLGVSFD